MRFILPPGSGGLVIFNLTRHQWGDVHFVLASVFALLMIVHIMLHWSWIICIVRGKQGMLMGGLIFVIFFLVVIGIAVIPFFAGMTGGDQGRHFRHGWHER